MGEAANIALRLNQHYSQLKSKNHETKTLRLDWDKYGEKSFEFKILELGPIWKDRFVRLQKERSYILHHKDTCYNQHLTTKKITKK